MREIHDASGLTTIFVTHDQNEAFDLADRVAVINQGVIEQIGRPVDIYDAPRSAFVFDFLGHTNSFACTIQSGIAKVGKSEITLSEDMPDGPGVAFVRPYDVILTPGGATDGESKVERSSESGPWVELPGSAIVRFISAIGRRAVIELIHNKRVIESEMSRETLKTLGIGVGSECGIALRRPRIYTRRQAEEQTRVTERERARPRFRSRFSRRQ